MYGVPGQCFPSRSSEAVQMRARRARLISPPSTPHQNVLGSRLLRHASRNGRDEPSSGIGGENVPQASADRQLKFGDVLTVFARLLASHEVRAALLFVDELVSSDVAHSELNSTLVTFNRQSVDFVKKYSSEVSNIASEFIWRGGHGESSTKTDIKAGRRGTKSDELTASARSGSNPVPNRTSDFVQRGGQSESSTEIDVKARMRATKSDEWSSSEAGSSMRRSVLQVCRRARDLTRRAAQVTSFSSVSDQENREAFASEQKPTCSQSSPGGAHSRAPSRYACTNMMIGASNRQRQARGQSYDGVLTSERSTICHAR